MDETLLKLPVGSMALTLWAEKKRFRMWLITDIPRWNKRISPWYMFMVQTSQQDINRKAPSDHHQSGPWLTPVPGPPCGGSRKRMPRQLVIFPVAQHLWPLDQRWSWLDQRSETGKITTGDWIYKSRTGDFLSDLWFVDLELLGGILLTITVSIL